MTVGVQAQCSAPAGAEKLVGYGKMIQRDRETFWCDVHMAAASSGNVVARGTVLYRIVVPE